MTWPNRRNAAIYTGSLALSTALLSFLLVLLIGPRIAGGEKLEALGLAGFFGIPIFFLFGAVAGASYPWFRSGNSALSATGVYLVALIVATLLGMSVMYFVI